MCLSILIWNIKTNHFSLCLNFFLLTSFVFRRRHCTFLLHSCGNEIKDRHLINVMSYIEALWYCASHKKTMEQILRFLLQKNLFCIRLVLLHLSFCLFIFGILMLCAYSTRHKTYITCRITCVLSDYMYVMYAKTFKL